MYILVIVNKIVKTKWRFFSPNFLYDTNFKLNADLDKTSPISPSALVMYLRWNPPKTYLAYITDLGLEPSQLLFSEKIVLLKYLSTSDIMNYCIWVLIKFY